MNKPLSDKEKLISMLTEISGQLEELEVVLEASFSDLRKSWDKEEHDKIMASKYNLVGLEQSIDKVNSIANLDIPNSNPNMELEPYNLNLAFNCR